MEGVGVACAWGPEPAPEGAADALSLDVAAALPAPADGGGDAAVSPALDPDAAGSPVGGAPSVPCDVTCRDGGASPDDDGDGCGWGAALALDEPSVTEEAGLPDIDEALLAPPGESGVEEAAEGVVDDSVGSWFVEDEPSEVVGPLGGLVGAGCGVETLDVVLEPAEGGALSVAGDLLEAVAGGFEELPAVGVEVGALPEAVEPFSEVDWPGELLGAVLEPVGV